MYARVFQYYPFQYFLSRKWTTYRKHIYAIYPQPPVYTYTARFYPVELNIRNDITSILIPASSSCASSTPQLHERKNPHGDRRNEPYWTLSVRDDQRCNPHNRFAFVCQQRQAWTRARRVNRSGGALTAPRDGATPADVVESSLLMLVACYRRSNVNAIPNHLSLTSLKFHRIS